MCELRGVTPYFRTLFQLEAGLLGVANDVVDVLRSHDVAALVEQRAQKRADGHEAVMPHDEASPLRPVTKKVGHLFGNVLQESPTVIGKRFAEPPPDLGVR
jgi:hypothetical protein